MRSIAVRFRRRWRHRWRRREADDRLEVFSIYCCCSQPHICHHWRYEYHSTHVCDEEEHDLRLVLDTRDRDTTNPRDKIYSLRGILKPRLAENFTVNYGDSVEMVYTDLSKLVLAM